MEIKQDQYELNDYFDKININSKGAFSLRGNYIHNDFIKINDNNIFYVCSGLEEVYLFVILIKLLNEDKNILISYYSIKINEEYNINIYIKVLLLFL